MQEINRNCWEWKCINGTSFSVFHTEATLSIGLGNVLIMVTSILQNKMSMLRSRACQISLLFYPNTSKAVNITLSLLPPSQLVRTGTIPETGLRCVRGPVRSHPLHKYCSDLPKRILIEQALIKSELFSCWYLNLLLVT